MLWRQRSAALLVALLAACGGGGGGSSAVPSAPVQHGADGSAQIRISIPVGSATSATRRRKQFISTAVQGATVGVAPHGSTSLVTTAFDLSTSSTLCTTSGSARTCTLAVGAPFGSDDFVVQTYDEPPANGAIPSSAHLLGQATIQNVSVVASGTSSPIAITVLGQVGSITAVAGGQLSIPADGSAHTQTLIVSGYDFGNNPISGTYANPISVTLSETGGTGHTQLVLNGSPSGVSATLSSSSDTLGIQYDGGGAPGYYASVVLSATGAASGSFRVVPMYVTTTSPYYSAANGIQFTAAGESATISISEAVGNQSYAASIFGGAACTSALSIGGGVTGSGSSASMTVSSLTAGASGCTISISDGLNTIFPLVAATTITNGGITIGGISEYTVASPANARLGDMTLGPDGLVYVGESIGGNIDQFATNGTYTQFAVPTANSGPGSLIAASDGAIWFVEKGSYKVGRMTTGGSFTEYTMPGTLGSIFPQGVVQGSDGFIYALDRGQLQVDQLSVAGVFGTTISLAGTLPYHIAADNAGNLYTIDTTHNQLDYFGPGFNPVTINIPTSGSGAQYLTVLNGPTLPEIFFTETSANTIGASADGAVTEYPIGQADQPGALCVGPDGNIWFVAPGTNSIGRFNVTTHAFTHYPIPTANASPMGITAGSDGRVWFSEWNTNKVGALTP